MQSQLRGTLIFVLKISVAVLCKFLCCIESDLSLSSSSSQDKEKVRHKDPRTSFFPVPSTNVGISPQNFLTFSFNPFGTLV